MEPRTSYSNGQAGREYDYDYKYEYEQGRPISQNPPRNLDAAKIPVKSR